MGKVKAASSAAKAGLKKKTQKVKNSVKAKPQKVVKAPKKVDDGAFGWKKIFILGEQIHTETMSNLHKGPYSGTEWDFGHLEASIFSLLKEHSECDIYFSGGSPQLVDYDRVESTEIFGAVPTPVIHAILVKHGHHPPEFVAIRDFQRGGEKIVSFREMKLSWQGVPQFQNRVFALQCMQRDCDLKNKKKVHLFRYEYGSLFTQRPSVDWKLDRHGKVDVRHACFTYESPDLMEPIDEEFDKDFHRLQTFIPDFLERNDLDETHFEGVKDAIRQAFDKAREKKVKKMNLFEHYDKDVLDNIKVAKLYPKNSFVQDQFKDAYVNEYYGKASLVV